MKAYNIYTGNGVIVRHAYSNTEASKIAREEGYTVRAVHLK